MPPRSSSSSAAAPGAPPSRVALPKARVKRTRDERTKKVKSRTAQEENERNKKKRQRLKPRSSREGIKKKDTKKRRRRQGFQGRGGRKTEARTPSPTVQGISSTCPICQEEYGPATFPVVHAPCGHVACAPCSVKWQQSKSSRTCAFCRSPVLSIAHCPLLEQLFAQGKSRRAATDAQEAVAEAGGRQDNEAHREELKKSLRDLSLGDLNEMPGDYRGHVVRAVASRAIRKGDLNLLQTCLKKYGARASTELLCTVAEQWEGDPRPPISLLLAHGCRVNGHAEDRPLLCAANKGNTQMMRTLIDMKADPSLTTGPSGETALHIAARRGRFEAARLLLDAGVPADLPDSSGQTPLSLAEHGKKMHMSYCCGYGTDDGSNCERCEARIQVHGEMRWRMNAKSQSARPDASQPERPVAPTNDEESNQSSSEWEASDTEVSDVEEYLESEEEEDEDGSEDGNEDEQDEDEES